MAWMIVRQEVNWSRPNSRYSFNAKAKDEPQQFPQDFVEYAISIGRAVRAKPPKRKPQGA